MKVIGAGFGRTGTLSLKHALEQLGFDKCYHMMEVHQNTDHVPHWRAAAKGDMPDWHTLFEGYQASVDWPACNYYRSQMEAFPEAKVLLSLRDPDRWYDSVMNTIWKFTKVAAASEEEAIRRSTYMAYEVIWDAVFDRRMDDKAHVIECYNRHNQTVIDTVPADRLLVFEASQGWAPLCQFLDVPVPDTEFPRVNSTEDFQAIWKR